MEFELENPLIAGDDGRSDSVADLFAAENDHLSSFAGGSSSVFRHNAVSLLIQVRFACNLDPFLIYLASNYIDRFLSKREIPSEKPWMVRLLCFSCLSLAAKMKKVDLFLPNLQRDEGFIFDSRTIKRMELLVLGALEWRMRSITPFAFVEYFVAFFLPDQPPLVNALRNRAIETIFLAQNEIRTLEFKPSEISAAALLSAAHELFPVQFPAFRSVVASSEFMNKEKLRECFALISYVVAMDGSDSCNTPVTVLAPFCSISSAGLGSDGGKLRAHYWD